MWAVSLVHTDDSLRWQRRLALVSSHEVSIVSTGLKYLCERGRFMRVGDELASLPPGLVLLGGSSFHHLAAHLIRQHTAKALRLVVFDQHADLYQAPPGHVSCGSWLWEVLELPEVEQVLLIGPEPEALSCKEDLPQKVICAPLPAARQELARLCSSSARIYVSLDKDVLAEAGTDWGTGRLSLRTLLTLLGELRRQGRLVGADICGEMVPRNLWPTAAELAQIRHNEDINLSVCRALSAVARVRSACRGRLKTVSAQGAVASWAAGMLEGGGTTRIFCPVSRPA